MDSTYFRRLEAAFNCVEDASTDAERQQIIVALNCSDPDLVDELSTLLALNNERVYNRSQASDKNLFDLLLTTLGEGSRKDSTASLLDFLSRTHGTSSENAIASLRGFSFRNLIATGPTGFVFEGFDEMLRRRVAIKVLAPSIASEPGTRGRFLSEARLATSITHQNVIDVYHVSADQDSTIVFFVMEWFEGESLQHWLGTNGFSKESFAFRFSIFQELAIGLSAIHEAGIIHRDLKPGNVMISKSGDTLKILDFGIAISSVSDNRTIPLAGTPLYMAPEQMAGELLTQRTDLFALAEIACVLLAGYHPFDASDLKDLTNKLEQGPEALRADSLIAPNLKSVLLKCLSQDPSGRFEDARSFRIAVEQALPEFSNRVGRNSVGSGGNSIDKKAIAEKGKLRELIRRLAIPMSLAIGSLFLIGSAYLLWNNAGSDVDIKAPSIADVGQRQKGKWLDEEHFENYEGVSFRKIAVGEASRDQKDQFAKEYPELSKNLGWSNFDSDDRWLVMEDLVSVQLYRRVMGLEDGEALVGNPISNIDYSDVKEFCRKLSENCPDGFLYSPVSKNQLCYAMFGQQYFIEGVPIEELKTTFQRLSNGQSADSQNMLTPPLINGLFGEYWEWTDGATIKSAHPNGVVNYMERIETPHERSYQIMGGGQSDIFVHRFNMASGMNDFYYDSDNLQSALEEDGQTAYLHPIVCDRPGWVSYRYRFPNGIRRAHIGNCISLLREDSQGGIEVRFRNSESASNLDDCNWVAVYDGAASKAQPFSADEIKPWRVDVSELLAGAIEVEIKYWIQSPREPTIYEQIARTVDTRSLTKRTMEFAVTAEGRLESMRQFSTVPASYRHPLLSFRVMAECPDEIE